MNTRIAIYWTATILTALAFLSGGVASLSRVDETVRGMVSLGYPVYFATLIGA